MKKTIYLASLLLTFGAVTNVQANEIRPVFSASADTDINAEVLVTTVYTDGSTDEITGGEGFTLSGGIYIPIEKDIGIQATIGYKIDSVDANNGTIDFTRIPLDVLVFKHFGDKHSIAAGGTYHLSPTFTCEVSGVCTGSLNFDSALGLIAEYSYAIKKNTEGGMKIGLRYTNISYELGAASLDGSSIGMILYLY